MIERDLSERIRNNPVVAWSLANDTVELADGIIIDRKIYQELRSEIPPSECVPLDSTIKEFLDVAGNG